MTIKMDDRCEVEPDCGLRIPRELGGRTWVDDDVGTLLAVLRQGKPNQLLQGKEIDLHAALDAASAKFLHLAAARLGWSARSTHRALKVARTIADLAGAATTQLDHVAEAVQYRRALLSP